MKFGKILALLAGLAILGAPLHYALPHAQVLQVTETMVKRMGTGATAQDIYLISTVDPETKDVHVFRNQDNGWYLKFASADVQARADQMKGDRELAKVTWYGWRIPMFSMFPNVISMKPVGTVYTPVSPFWIILGALGLAAGGGYVTFSRWRKRRLEKAKVEA